MAALTDNFNYFQPTNFKLVIDRKEYGNLQFLVQTVDHLSVSIDEPQVPYKRIQTISLTVDNVNFGDLVVEVIADEDLEAYTEMMEWLTDLTTKHHNDETKKIQTDMSLVCMSSHNNRVKTFRYIDCIPTFVGPLSLSSGRADNEVITFSVNFKFE